jgi:hypothetical protein
MEALAALLKQAWKGLYGYAEQHCPGRNLPFSAL